MSRPKFSVVLIARNEERTLPRMLASLGEFQKRGGEVVLMDTGSNDSTVDVALARNCDVHKAGDRFVRVVKEAEAKQINRRLIVSGESPVMTAEDKLFDYSAARNYAASLALVSNDMVAMPDCDEAFTKFDIDAIDQAIDDGAKRLEYNFVFAHDEHGNEAVKFLHSKFYDRRSFKWVGVIHEVLQPIASPFVDGHKTVFLSEDKVKLEHWQNHGTDRGGYLKGLALDCHEDPNNDRNSHYLGRELLYKGRPKSAVRELTRHVNMEAWPAERAQSMIYIGDAYLELGKEQLGLQMYHKAFLLEPSRCSLLRLARHFWRRDEPQRAAAYANAALTVPYTGFYASDMDEYRHVPHEILYWAFWRLGDEAASREHWAKAIIHQPFNAKFINEGQFYRSPPFGLDGFTRSVGDFSFVKLGDGEELCMRGAEGQNCDGQAYSEELGQKLRGAFEWMAPRLNVHVRHWADQAGVNLLLHREGSNNDKVKDFWLAIRGYKGKKVLVAPKRMQGLQRLLGARYFVEVPETNAFEAYDDVKRKLHRVRSVGVQPLGAVFDVALFCAGPMAKVLIADVLKGMGDQYSKSCIDVGSSFDSLFTGEQTRTEQLGHDEMARLYKDELGWPFVSICIPVLGRPEQTARLVEAIHRNAGFPAYEVVLEHDSFEDRRGCPETLKKAVKRSMGNLVMFLGNDCTPESDFLRKAVGVFKATFSDGKGLVALNDGYWDPWSIATHWLASKSMLPELGGEFFHTGYRHLGCDNELTARCKALGRYAFAMDARISHHHPTQTGWEKLDEVHCLAYDYDSVSHDRALLRRRLCDLGLELVEPKRQ